MIYNAGGGFKVFAPHPVILRLEYRLQNFSGDLDYLYHNVFFGISVFLN